MYKRQIAYSLAVSEIAIGDPAVAVTMCVNNMVCEVIQQFGTDAQKQTHVVALQSGDYVAGSFCLSEPGAGSDPQGMSTRAVKTANGWTISGSKAWITSGTHAGVFLVWAKTDDSISVFLVDPKTPGISVGKPEQKMGQHASDTVAVSFDNVEISDDALLGEIGMGFKIAMMALDGGRIGIASQAVGIATAALECARLYATERHQFGKPLTGFQAIQFKLADMAAKIEGAKLLTHRAAWLKENGKRFTREASIAKLVASEMACEVCDEAIQIHGGYGYTHEYFVEKLYRDARVTRIYEGTSEIQRIVISRDVIKNGL